MAKRKGGEDQALTPLGARIMAVASEAGFTQSSLERAGHFSGGYLNKLLYRPQDRIDMSKLEKLSDLLGVRMHWLATGRDPKREGEQRTSVEEGMIVARGLGVTEDVFWFVRGRDGDVERSPKEWAVAFFEENKKRVEDEAYAKAAKRVAMSEKRRAPPPPSEARQKRTKVA